MLNLYFWRPFIAVSLIFATAFFAFAYLQGHQQPRFKAVSIALLSTFLATIFLVLAFGIF